MKGIFRKKSPGKTVIGIVGMAPGIGVTHLSLSLANYIAERWHGKVAVLECNTTHDFTALAEEYGKSSDHKHFHLMGVDYYRDVDECGITEVLNQGFDYYILDFGCEYPTWEKELMRCDRKLVIGSCSTWRRYIYHEFITYFNFKISMGWKHLCIAGWGEDKKEIEKRFGIQIESIPFLENPFEVKREYFGFLEHLL